MYFRSSEMANALAIGDGDFYEDSPDFVCNIDEPHDEACNNVPQDIPFKYCTVC